MKNLLGLVAILVAGTALFVSWNQGRTVPAGRIEAAPQGLDIFALQQRIEALETRVATLTSDASLEPTGEPLVRVLPEEVLEARAEEAVRRVLSEEREQGKSEKRPETTSRIGRFFGKDDDEDPTARLAQVREAVGIGNDSSLPEESRLQALRLLRFSRDEQGLDARLGVVDSMVTLGMYSEEPAVRADVWRQMSGLTEQSMLQPLLDALRADPDAEVREEAAETLIDFLPDPVVEAALRDAAANDPDENVRDQASEWNRRRRR